MISFFNWKSLHFLESLAISYADTNVTGQSGLIVNFMSPAGHKGKTNDIVT